jgi:hypothetical protein
MGDEKGGKSSFTDLQYLELHCDQCSASICGDGAMCSSLQFTQVRSQYSIAKYYIQRIIRPALPACAAL